MNQMQKQIKMPREHPILRNIFLFIFCALIVAPMALGFIIKIADVKNAETVSKTEQTIGEILNYNVITDSKGNAIYYNTTIEYTINKTTRHKVFQTNFYVADPGQYVLMFYAKGNPDGADIIKESNSYNNLDKLRIYMTIVVLIGIAIMIKCYNDIIQAQQRKRSWAQMQYMMNSYNQNNIIK